MGNGVEEFMLACTQWEVLGVSGATAETGEKKMARGFDIREF